MSSVSRHNSNEDQSVKPIEFYYNEVEISGKILIRTKRDLVVEMTSPYKGFKNGLHKPHFSASRFSYLDEEGSCYGKSLLLELYKQLLLLENKSKEIDQLYPTLIIKRDIFLSLIQKSKEALIEEKQKMKSHIITPIKYQRTIKPIKKLIKNLEFETFTLETQFFENFTQTIIPYSLRTDYVKYLDMKYSK